MFIGRAGCVFRLRLQREADVGEPVLRDLAPAVHPPTRGGVALRTLDLDRPAQIGLVVARVIEKTTGTRLLFVRHGYISPCALSALSYSTCIAKRVGHWSTAEGCSSAALQITYKAMKDSACITPNCPESKPRMASISFAGARSPVQLILRGASIRHSLKSSFLYRRSIRSVAWFDTTVGPGCFAAHSASRI